MPRALAGLTRFVDLLAELGVGVGVPPASGAIGENTHTLVPHDSLFLGQAMLAAARNDTKAMEDLTAQVDPINQLRQLIAAAQQGEPIRELEPDEAALRAAATARKAARFVQFEAPKVENIRAQRPLPQLLVDVLPRLWAAALEGRFAWGDPLNWIGQVACAANDPAVPSPVHAERAAVLYGLRMLNEAYGASKRGDRDS